MRWWAPVILLGCGDDPDRLSREPSGPPVFALGGDAWLPAGRSFDLAVTGAPAGSFVGYVASTGSAPPLFCPPSVGCFDLTAPGTLIGVTMADATGVASYSRSAPARLQPYRTMALQAASVVGGQATFSSVHRMTVLGADFCVSNLSWPWAMLGDGGDPSDVLGAVGLQFSAAGGHGLVGGDAEGDPGGWSDGRSVMTPGWVVVGRGSIRFGAPSSHVGLSVGRAGGGTSAEVEITGMNGGSPMFVSTVTATTSPVTMTFAGPLDHLEVAQIGGDSPALVVDDLAWRDFGAGCP